MPEHSSLGCLRGEKENLPQFVKQEKVDCSSASPLKVSFAQQRDGGNPITQRKRRLQTILTAGKLGAPIRPQRSEISRVCEDEEDVVKLEQSSNIYKNVSGKGGVNTHVASAALVSSPVLISRPSQSSSLMRLLDDDEAADKAVHHRRMPPSPAESVRSTIRSNRRTPKKAPSPASFNRRRQAISSMVSDSPASSLSSSALLSSNGSLSSGGSLGTLKSRASSRTSAAATSPLSSANNTVVPNLRSLLNSSTPHHPHSTSPSSSASTGVATFSASATSLPSSSASVAERTGGNLRSRLHAMSVTPSTTSYLSSVSPLEALTDYLPSSCFLSESSSSSSNTAPAPHMPSSLSAHTTPAASLRPLRTSTSSTPSVFSTPSVSASTLATTPALSQVRSRSHSTSVPVSSAISPLAPVTSPPTNQQQLHTANTGSDSSNNSSSLPSLASLSLNSLAVPSRHSSSTSHSSNHSSHPSAPASSVSSSHSASQSTVSANSSQSLHSAPHPSSVHSSQPSSHHASASSKPRKDKEEAHYVNGKQYFVLEAIGQGGSSTVYRVLSKEKKVFALKRISISGGEVNHIANYHNEIALLQRLRGRPYVIQLIDFQEDLAAGVIYMVFELGTMDLANYLQVNQNSKTWDNNSIRYFWKQMLECTQMCHDEQILHLDLKPPNFVLVDGSLKLIDFGIAKEVAADMTHILNEDKVGTLDYMSPESVVECRPTGPSGTSQAHKLGRSSDVWSLGCILYQMVYKTPPFKRLPLYQKMSALMNPKHVIPFGPCDDPSLLQVMKACLQHNPKNRPTIAQLLAHPYLMPRHDVVGVQHLELILRQLGVSNSSSMATGIVSQIQAGQAIDISKLTS